MAEEYFSRLRRAEIGHHHHIAGAYLLRYAQEASWREDNRRVTNGEQVHRIAGLAMRRKPSVDFSGYWQRHVKAAYRLAIKSPAALEAFQHSPKVDSPVPNGDRSRMARSIATMRLDCFGVRLCAATYSLP
jgi:hypothetical protein